MSYRDYDRLVTQRLYDNVVWEAPEEKPLGPFSPCGTRHICEGNNYFFEEIKSGVYCLREF